MKGLASEVTLWWDELRMGFLSPSRDTLCEEVLAQNERYHDMCACVRACVRACVCACVRECGRADVRAGGRACACVFLVEAWCVLFLGSGGCVLFLEGVCVCFCPGRRGVCVS